VKYGILRTLGTHGTQTSSKPQYAPDGLEQPDEMTRRASLCPIPSHNPRAGGRLVRVAGVGQPWRCHVFCQLAARMYCHCRTAVNVMLVGEFEQFSITPGLVQVRLLPLTVPDTLSVPVQGVPSIAVAL